MFPPCSLPFDLISDPDLMITSFPISSTDPPLDVAELVSILPVFSTAPLCPASKVTFLALIVPELETSLITPFFETSPFA